MDEKGLLDRINARDAAGLSRLAVDEPIPVLAFLDGVMRGLVAGSVDLATIEWLEGIDVVLRRWLALNSQRGGGPSELDLDVAILRGAYMHGSLYLVVGAGISQGAGISGWRDLVVKVLHAALDDGGSSPDACRRAQHVLAELEREERYTSETLLHATEAAHEVLGSRFYDCLRRVIYATHAIRETEAHRAIARLVRPKSGPATPRIFSILTYNFDDLLEKSIWAAGWNFKAWCSVRGEWRFQYDRKPRPLAIEIYHLHGYVPRETDAPEGIDLVFTTDGYRAMYRADRTFANIVAPNHLQNALGLVIGSSLKDTYATEQWKQVRKPGWYNYALMERSDERAKEFYRELGLRVIWIDDFREISELLNRVSGPHAD